MTLEYARELAAHAVVANHERRNIQQRHILDKFYGLTAASEDVAIAKAPFFNGLQKILLAAGVLTAALFTAAALIPAAALPVADQVYELVIEPPASPKLRRTE